MKSFIILGVGRFGASLAKTLYELGHEVLVIDEKEEIVAEISEHVTHAVIGDCSDENTLKSLGVRNFDIAVVAIGGNMESSILVTLMLKEMGVQYIVAKAQSNIHARVLSRVGADKVILPERDMGVRLAQSLAMHNILDFIEVSPRYSILEITTPELWIGKSLKDINVRVKHGINILAIKTGDDIDITPDANRVLGAEDVMIVIGSNEDLNKLSGR